MNNNRGQTKLVVITSDDDLIRQITDVATASSAMRAFDLTHITEQSTKSTSHFTDLTFLTQPSDLGDGGDQTFRQVLDLPSATVQSKSNTAKKTDLVCAVCGGKASAYNYSALTCGSCKIFFHRNAFESLEKKRCLNGDGKCSVFHDIRRKCAHCRLQHCFASGMSTDYFLTNEEIERRKKRRMDEPSMVNIHPSTCLQSEILPVPTSNEIDHSSINAGNILIDPDEYELLPLPIEEQFCIESLQSSFRLIFQHTFLSSEQLSNSTYNMHDQISTIAAWTQVESSDVHKLINVFRQVKEFEALGSDDRFTLIKYNSFSLFMLHKCLIFDPVKGVFLKTPDKDLDQRRWRLTVCPGSVAVKAEFMQWMHATLQVTKQDSTLLQLLLVVLLFSKGISMIEDEPPLIDSTAVYRAQIYYIHLIWNYLLSKWGYEQTVVQFSQLLNQIFRLQAMTKSFRSVLKNEIAETDTIENIAPLMQTVLHISVAN